MSKLVILAAATLLLLVVACSQPAVNISEVHCQSEDIAQIADGYVIIDTVGPELRDSDSRGWRESLSTEWADLPDGFQLNIHCLTVVYDSTENARLALNSSTAIQNVWPKGELELLAQLPVLPPTIGEESIAFKIEAGRRWGTEVHRNYATTTVMFNRENVVVMVTSGVNCLAITSLACDYLVNRLSVDVPANIASRIDRRILAELG